MAKEQPLSLQRDIQRKFLWYDVELVDASATIFSGVLTFVALLNGAVVFRRRVGNHDPVLIMRVKHPAGGAGRHDYSYGLLLEAHGTVSDYSGWLLFYDCCGDYSGFAGSQHALAEQEIKEHLEQKTIEIQEVTITKSKLLEVMHGNLLSTTKDVMLASEQTQSKLRDTENKLGAARGLLVELLGMRHYYSAPPGAIKVEWAYERLGQEIDVLVRTKQSLIFVECKKPAITDPLQQVDKLKRKADVLLSGSEFRTEWNSTSDTHLVHAFVTWEQPSSDVLRTLSQSGVEVVVLSKAKAGIGRKTRDRLKTALDADRPGPKTRRSRFLGAISL